MGVEILSDDPLTTGTGEVSPGPGQREPDEPLPRTVPRPREIEAPGADGLTVGSSRWATPERVERRDLDLLPDLSDRMTLRFLGTMVGRDGDRLPRALGWSYMQRAAGAFDQDADWADGARLAEENEALQSMALGILRRPFQHALRELPIVRNVEMEVEDFKAQNVPTSGAWLDSRDEDRFSAGRLSFRWHLRDGSDPIAVSYALQGWRLGLSRETVRFGYSTALNDCVDIHISTSFDHEKDATAASGELLVDLTPGTRLRLRVATDIDAFPGADLAREVAGTRDAGPGAMVYVETVF